MKKFFQNIIARALCVLVFGILLIVFNQRSTELLVRACGVVFIIPGLVALISYYRRDPENRQIMLYPILGAGSILFGLVLLIWPELFMQIMMYILSGLLLIMAAAQYYTLWDIHRKAVPIHLAYYIVPTLELTAALYVLLTAKEAAPAGLPVILVGIGYILYAALELWSIQLLRTSNKPLLPQTFEEVK